MHIVVCVKQVPDTTEVRIDPKTNTLVREGVPSIINPYDAHAVEEAVRLKEQYGGSVTVISMGPPQAKDVLKRAIGVGADRAILISDRAFAGSDTLATSYVLTKAIEKLSSEQKVDLIFCGMQAIDGDTAQVGPGVASRLKISQLTYVKKVDWVSMESQEIQVVRKLEEGREVVRAKLPALITAVKDLNELRYSALPDLIRAARYDVPVWGKADLSAEDIYMGLKGSPTNVARIFAPPGRSGGEIIPGGVDNPKQAVKVLVDKLFSNKQFADDYLVRK